MTPKVERVYFRYAYIPVGRCLDYGDIQSVSSWRNLTCHPALGPMAKNSESEALTECNPSAL